MQPQHSKVIKYICAIFTQKNITEKQSHALCGSDHGIECPEYYYFSAHAIII